MRFRVIDVAAFGWHDSTSGIRWCHRGIELAQLLQCLSGFDAVARTLADRTRRDIMRRVLTKDHSISTLAASYDTSFAAVQKHAAVLEKAQLITKRRSGREALASGEVVRSVASMLAELEDIWRGRIARLDQLFEQDPPNQHPTERT